MPTPNKTPRKRTSWLSGGIAVLVLGLTLAGPALAREDSASEGSSPYIVTDGRDEAYSAATHYTKEFFLGRSEYFSVEVSNAGSSNYDLDVQFWTYDTATGANKWQDYDLGTGSDVAGITDAFHITDITIPYFSGPIRLKVTVNSGAVDYTILINRDSGARNP